MIPVLFAENETNFTASEGLGALSEAESCHVIEERNGQYVLEMVYPLSGKRYSDIKHERIIYAVPSDGTTAQPFRIYKIFKPLNGRIKVMASHISYQLKLIPCGPFTATNAPQALQGLKTHALEPCRFTFWTDKSTQANYKQETPAGIRERLGGVEGSILDTYGGEYEWDTFTVKLHNNRGSDRGAVLKYGKNITDINQEENIENTITGVVGFWYQEGTLVQAPAVYTANADLYPYKRTIALDFTSEFETVPTVAQLTAKAQSYLAGMGVPAVSINVSFVALWQTEEYKHIANLERVKLCDTITVEFEKLQIQAKAKVIRTDYDVLRDRYISIEVGDYRTDLSTQIATMNQEIKRSGSIMQQAIDSATNLITGGLGGYVVMKRNANGKPEEILIMDTEDVQTAVNVIRMNKNGIGFSTTGYNGPFTTAWTIDGSFVADFITAGTLRAIDIDGVNITGATITGNEISGGTINGTAITGGTIDGNQITGSAISGGTISGTTVTGGTVSGTTITGSSLTSETTNWGTRILSGSLSNYNKNTSAKLILSESSLSAFNGNGARTFALITNYVPSIELTNEAGDRRVFINEQALSILNPSVNQAYITANYGNGLGVKWAGKGFEANDTRIAVVNGTALKFYSYADTGNTYVAGTLSVVGTKSRIADTKNYGERLFYCYETPTPYFGDLGEGKTDESGKCYIFLDDILDETIEGKYQVFLQAYGDGRLYVSERTASYFVVEGEPNTAFGWELKAPQRGYSLDRLEPYEQTEQEDEKETVLDTTYQYLTEQLYDVEGEVA